MLVSRPVSSDAALQLSSDTVRSHAVGQHHGLPAAQHLPPGHRLHMVQPLDTCALPRAAPLRLGDMRSGMGPLAAPSPEHASAVQIPRSVPCAAWTSFVQWTCYNTCYLIFLIHAHNGNPWNRSDGARARALAHAASLRDQRCMQRAACVSGSDAAQAPRRTSRRGSGCGTTPSCWTPRWPSTGPSSYSGARLPAGMQAAECTTRPCRPRLDTHVVRVARPDVHAELVSTVARLQGRV